MKPVRQRLLLLSLLAVVAVALLVLFVLRQSALPVLASDPNFGVTTTITVGTNHVYYYGDTIQSIFDPVITRLSDTNAYRLRKETSQPSTMIWIRLKHPDFRLGPSVLIPGPSGPVRKNLDRAPAFRAILKDPTGKETVLERSPALHHFKQKVVVGGYLLPGPLDPWRGGTLLLESPTNREPIASFRIP